MLSSVECSGSSLPGRKVFTNSFALAELVVSNNITDSNVINELFYFKLVLVHIVSLFYSLKIKKEANKKQEDDNDLKWS